MSLDLLSDDIAAHYHQLTLTDTAYNLLPQATSLREHWMERFLADIVANRASSWSMSGAFTKWRLGYDPLLRKRYQFIKAVLEEVMKSNHVLLRERVQHPFNVLGGMLGIVTIVLAR